MAHYNFKKDLVVGDDGQQIVADILISEGGEFISSNDDYRYDLEMYNKKRVKTYHEVKTDVFCKPDNDTGNIFIEFKCRGKASGIDVTIADWFDTYFKHLNQVWFIRTDKLKKLISENNFYYITNGGDKGSNTHGYLIKREVFKEHFHVRYL